jgi:hypothetical protein
VDHFFATDNNQPKEAILTTLDTPLLVRLVDDHCNIPAQDRGNPDHGRIPAGIPVQFPHDLALLLIKRGLATPVDEQLAPNFTLILDDDDLDQVRLGRDYWSSIQKLKA